MSTAIESSIPPGYRRVESGCEILEGDLLWNFVELMWQAADGAHIQSTVGRASYVIRKVTAFDQEQLEPQLMPKSYGGW